MTVCAYPASLHFNTLAWLKPLAPHFVVSCYTVYLIKDFLVLDILNPEAVA
jgi:hypothetical protein